MKTRHPVLTYVIEKRKVKEGLKDGTSLIAIDDNGEIVGARLENTVNFPFTPPFLRSLSSWPILKDA